MSIQETLAQTKQAPAPSQPIFFDLSDTKDLANLEKLHTEGKIQHIVDDYEEQQKEYFQMTNPSTVYAPDFPGKFKEYFEGIQKERPLWRHGRWVFYPWLSTLVHILEEEAFQVVRTGRNRNLINKEEQDKFYNTTIGIAGLSIGNSVALAVVLQGGGKHIKLADHDQLVLSNTYRVRAGVENLGLPKAELTARQIYELNPYANVELFLDGLTTDNIERFFSGLDIVVDEIDNLAVKYLIREHAKKQKLPVVMGADNGDSAVLEIERYDEDPDTEFFHGRMGKVTYEELKGLDKFGIGKKITEYVGTDTVTERMQQSLLEMGKTVVSWPQLGGAAMLNGAALAYCIRKILNGQLVENDRAVLSFDEKLIPNYNTPEEAEKRKKVGESFKKIFGL